MGKFKFVDYLPWWNGRLRLLGPPRYPRPDFPLETSTRARRPQIIRPSKPRTASSAIISNRIMHSNYIQVSTATTKKLVQGFTYHLLLIRTQQKQNLVDCERSTHFSMGRSSWTSLLIRFYEHDFPSHQHRLLCRMDNGTFSYSRSAPKIEKKNKANE